MIRKSRDHARVYDGWADGLAYVFEQLDAKGLGKKASGYEYVPNRRSMSRWERMKAREALRANLSASLNLCASESGVVELPDGMVLPQAVHREG